MLTPNEGSRHPCPSMHALGNIIYFLGPGEAPVRDLCWDLGTAARHECMYVARGAAAA